MAKMGSRKHLKTYKAPVILMIKTKKPTVNPSQRCNLETIFLNVFFFLGFTFIF